MQWTLPAPTSCARSALVLLIACSPGTDRDSLSTVSIIAPIDEYGFSWHWSQTAQFLVFSPLVARNAHGELEPRLARRWEHTPDYREWTVWLDTRATWHDGVTVTAQDVAFTLDLITTPGVARHAVDVVSDSVYRIRYEAPGIGNPLDDYSVIYPRHLLADLDRTNWEGWDFWTEPVGSGPFRHVHTTRGVGFELEANPDYFRGRPRIDRVFLKFGEPQITQFLSGDTDVLPNVSELDVVRLADDDRFVVFRWPNYVRSHTVSWNHRSVLFEDPDVRRALAQAVDRVELRRVLGYPDTLPIFDGLYSDRQFRRGEFPPAVSFDPEAAKRILAETGWVDRDGDGIRDRDGRPFRFTLLSSSGSGGGWSAPSGEGVTLLMRQHLQDVGIDVTIQPMQGSVVRDRVAAGDFEAATVDIASYLWRTSVFGRESWLGYTNPEAHELIDRIGAAFDPDSVDLFYDQLAGIFADDHPVLFLYPAVQTTIVNRRLRGMSSPHRADAIWYLEDFWIEEAE